MLGKRVGRFVHEFGAYTEQVMKDEAEHQMNMRTLEEWRELYDMYLEGRGDRGILLSLYDYEPGGIGSVSVELTPDFESGELELFYNVYTELHGNNELSRVIEVGAEAELIQVLDETLMEASKEFKNA